MSAPTLFVTGTDTGIGKTRAAAALLYRGRQEGLRVGGFKPLASGAESTAFGLRNEDALALMRAAGEVDAAGGEIYRVVNPFCFAPAIAPHLAAAEVGIEVSLEALDHRWQARTAGLDLVVVEGAGGWLVPINAHQSYADWVSTHRWPVVLVVGMRLGCINHALLSAEAICRRTPMAGWIANRLPPLMPRLEENLQTLRRWMPVPCLGEIGCGQPAVAAAADFDWPRLQAVSGDGKRFTAASRPI